MESKDIIEKLRFLIGRKDKMIHLTYFLITFYKNAFSDYNAGS